MNILKFGGSSIADAVKMRHVAGIIEDTIKNSEMAIVLSAFIFAIVHEPIAIGMAFGGGLLYGWLRVRTGSIVPSMIAHMIWNSFISLIILFY